jgi:hypothetical protein
MVKFSSDYHQAMFKSTKTVFPIYNITIEIKGACTIYSEFDENPKGNRLSIL